MSTMKMQERQQSANAQELQELVHRASMVIAHYWPMTTFVHHNPIRSLETLPFHNAIRVAQRFIGGRGYLPTEMYRQLVKSGRITPQYLDAALGAFAQDKEVKLGERMVSHFEVVRAHLLEGITAPSDETIPTLINRMPNSVALRSLAGRLSIQVEPRDETGIIARDITLAAWCDQAMNTNSFGRSTAKSSNGAKLFWMKDMLPGLCPKERRAFMLPGNLWRPRNGRPAES